MDETEPPQQVASAAVSTSVTSLPPQGWYADPWGVAPWRWWDGRRWTSYAGASEPRRTTARAARGILPPRREVERADPAAEPGMRGGIIALVGFLASTALATGAVVLATRDGSRSVGFVALFYVVLWAGLLATCAVAVRRCGSGSLRDLGLARPRVRQIGVGALAGVAIWFSIAQIAARLVPFLDKRDLGDSSRFTAGLDANWMSVLVLTGIAVVGAPFFEELFFRGLVQGVLLRRWGSRIAIPGQALLFTTVHFTVDMTAARALLTFVTIGLVGVCLGWLRWYHGRLTHGMAAHATFNAIVTVVFLVAL